MNFRSLNIGTKLVLSVAIGIILGIIVLVSTVSIYISENMEKEAKDSIFLASKRYTNYIRGILNETVVLTKGTATSLNEMFQHNQVDADLIKILMKNLLDSSLYSTYTFLYLKDTSVLANTQGIDKKYISPDGKTFAMIYFDQTTGKSAEGGIDVVQTPNNFNNLKIIQEVEKDAKYEDKDNLFVGPPTKLNYGGKDFLGINFGMPIFNNKGKLIGVTGYTLDFSEISKTILDPRLNFLEGGLRLLMTDKGIITIDKNPNAILKTLSDINKHPSAELVNNAVKEHKTVVIDDYVASTGDLSYASVSSFSSANDSSYWSMVVTAPKNTVLAPLKKLEIIFIIISFFILLIILAIVYFCINKIVGSRIPI
ncbi:cache domain-containing protein, partial [Campylobacter jejuni]|nr:cache domain-containing protein [Campylobacter jejuni]MBC5861734.1 cache domain-containing protein [Campylobacter jejuni]